MNEAHVQVPVAGQPGSAQHSPVSCSAPSAQGEVFAVRPL
jgi:hypothetical protein